MKRAYFIFRSKAFVCILFLLALTLPFVSGCARSSKGTKDTLEDDSYQLIVFIKRDTDDESTRLLKEKIEGLDYVTKVEWITKKQVLQSLFEEYSDYADIFDMFAADNPLMDELRITISGGEDAVNSVLEWLDDRGDDGGIKDCIEKYDGPRRKEKTA